MKLNIQMQEKTQPIHETEMSQRENGLPTFKKIFFFLLKLPLYLLLLFFIQKLFLIILDIIGFVLTY